MNQPNLAGIDRIKQLLQSKAHIITQHKQGQGTINSKPSQNEKKQEITEKPPENGDYIILPAPSTHNEEPKTVRVGSEIDEETNEMAESPKENPETIISEELEGDEESFGGHDGPRGTLGKRGSDIPAEKLSKSENPFHLDVDPEERKRKRKEKKKLMKILEKAEKHVGINKKSEADKKTFRRAGGEVWNDPSLKDWPENDFRLFVGNLGNEVKDDDLMSAFKKYSSCQRAKVIRSRGHGGTKGYGFVSMSKPEDYLKALKEMHGKYIGNRPVQIKASKWRERSLFEGVSSVPIQKVQVDNKY